VGIFRYLNSIKWGSSAGTETVIRCQVAQAYNPVERIMVVGQPKAKSFLSRPPSQPVKALIVVCACHPALQEV
jgi:hypothetical protein